MGTLSGSGGVSAGLYIMYFSGKREARSFDGFSPGGVRPIDPAWSWVGPIRSGENISFYGGIQEALELCCAYF